MLNYYQVLEIPDFADDEKIRKAFRRKCRQYHPDLVNTMGPKISALAQREMAFINKAYEVLGSAGRRSDYDAWLREAGGSDILRTCRLCGINFSLDEEHTERGLCPLCLAEYHESERDAAASGRARGADAELLIRTCITVLHHFASDMVLRKFTPNLNLIVCGERLKITGPPGPLEATVFSRRIHEQSSGRGAQKHAWNQAYNMGKLTFGDMNPAQAATRITTFLRETFGTPWLEFARISIEDEDFKSYEHILNQSVLVAAGQLSPWTASKLYTRHHTNLFKALSDPDALVPDPFFSVMAQNAPARPGGGDAKKLKKENKKLREELEAERRKFESHIQRQRRRLEEKHDRNLMETQAKTKDQIERVEKQAGEMLKREKSRAQLKKQFMENELAAVRGELEARTRDLYQERAAATHLNARIAEITRKAVEAFEEHAAFAPGIPAGEIQPDDLGFLIQNMAHEIQLLRARAQGETRALEAEIETARERIKELETRLEREAETLRRVRDTVERHRQRAAGLVRRHGAFAPEIAPGNVQVTDLFAIIETMAQTIKKEQATANAEIAQLKTEIEHARRDCVDMSRKLERERANIERLIQHIERHWRLAAQAAADYPEFAKDIAPARARVPDMSAMLRAMHEEIKKLRNDLPESKEDT